MKKLGKLKLNQLRDASLSNEDMKILVGGDRACTCSCLYADYGGSSSSDNSKANYNKGSDGGYSTGGCNNYTTIDGYNVTGGYNSDIIITP